MPALPHPEPLSGESYSAVELSLANDRVVMLDQRLLPEHEHYVQLASVAEVAAVSYTHLRSPRDTERSRMPSSA